MFDFTSVAFALTYACLLVICAKCQPAIPIAVIAVLAVIAAGAGAVAAMVKPVAVFAINLLVVAHFVCQALARDRSARSLWATAWQERRKIALCLAVMAVPLIATVVWSRVTEGVAFENPVMSTPNALTDGYVVSRSERFGIWSAGLHLAAWGLLLRNTGLAFSPVVLALALAVVLRRRGGKRTVAELYLASVVAVLVALTFFRMFSQHDYYFINIAPIVALVTGAAIAEIFSRVESRKSRATATIAVSGSAIAAYAILYWAYVPCMERMGNIAHERSVVAVGKLMQEITESNCILATEDWVAPTTIPFACRRRALDMRVSEPLLADEGLRGRIPYLITVNPKTPALRRFPKAALIAKCDDIRVFATGMMPGHGPVSKELFEKWGVTPIDTR